MMELTRRGFLKLLASAAAVIAAPKIVTAVAALEIPAQVDISYLTPTSVGEFCAEPFYTAIRSISVDSDYETIDTTTIFDSVRTVVSGRRRTSMDVEVYYGSTMPEVGEILRWEWFRNHGVERIFGEIKTCWPPGLMFRVASRSAIDAGAGLPVMILLHLDQVTI